MAGVPDFDGIAPEKHVQYWGGLIGDASATDIGDLFGLFQYFRPDGKGVEAVFSPYQFGDEVLARVRKVYDCTSDGYQESDAYFIPRPAKKCNSHEAEELLQKHFYLMRTIAKGAKNKELLKILKNVSLTQASSEEELMSFPYSYDCPESLLYNSVSDFFCNLDETPLPTLYLLGDALYSIANDIYVSEYLRWPVYQEPGDPFAAAFDLWSKGVRFVFRNHDTCHYVV